MAEVPWSVYLLRRRDGALYTGIATDVARRLGEHEGGGARGAKSLRGRGPLRLVLQREVGSRARAQRLEDAIQRLTKAEKERLVARGELLEALLERLGDEPPR